MSESSIGGLAEAVLTPIPLAPAKIAPLGERPGLHYKAHLARARTKDPTLSERELGRELWPHASEDSSKGRLRNLKTTIQHHPDTITTIAAHFGVEPGSFYAPIEAAEVMP